MLIRIELSIIGQFLCEVIWEILKHEIEARISLKGLGNLDSKNVITNKGGMWILWPFV